MLSSLIALCPTAGLAATEAVGAPPPQVIENIGQADPKVLYYTRCDGMDVYFTGDALVFDLWEARRKIVMIWSSGSSRLVVDPVGRSEARVHVFLGQRARWRSGLPVYGAVVYRDPAGGVELLFRPQGGGLRYEVAAAREAGLRAPQFRFVCDTGGEDGAAAGFCGVPAGRWLHVSAEPGESAGIICCGGSPPAEEMMPSAPGDAPSQPGRPSADDREAFKNNEEALLWGTLLGGSDFDYAHGLAVCPSGDVIVAGYTRSFNFPTTPGAYDVTQAGNYDLFVAKLDPDGSHLLWSTYIGGGAEDRPFCVDIDRENRPIIAGYTYSSDFPTTAGAYDRTLSVPPDAFVLKLDSNGSHLLWSTYIGGAGADRIWASALDGSDRSVVCGATTSIDFPTTSGVYDPFPNGADDGFITKLDATGQSLVWSTVLGGTSDDHVSWIALDPQANAFVSGTTYSSGFPATTGAFDTTHNGGADAYVAELDASGSQLIFSTFLGGPGWDAGNAVTLDASGNPVVSGATMSSGFPTTVGAYDRSHNGDRDLFVSKLDGSGASILWSTFIGGSSIDEVFSVVTDPYGAFYVTGETSSSDFPTTPDGFDSSYGGNLDAFLVRVNPMGSALLWSTYVGGSQLDSGWKLAVDPIGRPIIAGPTRSTDFPTSAGAYDRSLNGEKDAFVACFDVPHLTVSPEVGEISHTLAVWPNPFSDGVWIESSGPAAGDPRLLVVDATGREVRVLSPVGEVSGRFRCRWDGRDDRGRSVPSGVYWLKPAGGRSPTRRMVACVR